MRVLTVAILLLGCFAATTAPVRAQSVGEVAPDFTFTTLEGDELSLSDYEGKVVFLFLLGDQCPYCRAVGNRTETEVHDVFAPTGEFQAIGLDLWNGSAASMRGFREHTSITYPLCLNAGSMASLYSTTYDRTVVIDREGIIRYKGTSRVENTLDEAKAVIAELLETPTAVEDVPAEAFALRQNYPNPFASSTTIAFTMPETGRVVLRVYDLLGNVVRTLVDGTVPAGRQRVVWDGADASGRRVAAGVYFYTLQTPAHMASRAMTVVR